MSASQALIGHRIRRLRYVSGLGQVEFAALVGIGGGSISKLVNGRMPVSDDLLTRIGNVVGCSPTFLTADIRMTETTKPWLRAYADAPKRIVDQQVEDCTTAIEAATLLGMRQLPDVLPIFDGDLLDTAAIEEFALDVRAAAELSEGAVVGNAVRAAERLGCVVIPMTDELGKHLGLSVRANGVGVISLGRRTHGGRGVPGDRQRFTVAHELGHLALHASLAPPSTAEEASLIEKQAHAFAGAFLAPGDAMLDELAELGGRVTLQTLSRIKERWGVSIKSLVTRFRSLGVIDADHARSLFKQISARGWNKSEPVSVGNEEAIWYSRALSQATGASAAAAINAASTRIGLDRRHFRRWTDWAPIEERRDAEVLRPNFGSGVKALTVGDIGMS